MSNSQSLLIDAHEIADGRSPLKPLQEIGFHRSIDRPAGRVDSVLSAITGKPLRYFTPDPLPELLDRCRLSSPVGRDHVHDSLLPLLLVRPASIRVARGDEDVAQAHRFAQFLATPPRYSSVNALIALCRDINPDIQGLRGEIIFMGGLVPSSARHIYSPHSTLPALMESLVSGLADEQIRGMDPLVVAAVVGLFCAYIHPFKDGNGRWARLVATSAGQRAGSAWLAMVGVVFQNACKTHQAYDIWSDATTSGFRRYLSSALRFESALDASLIQSSAFKAAGCLNAALQKASRSKRECASLLSKLYCEERIPIQALRAQLGLSTKAMHGLIDKIVSGTGALVDIRHDRLDIQGLCDKVNDSIDAGITAALN